MTYEVGQEVWVRDVNEGRSRGPVRGTIVKIGRSLVHVDHPHTYGRGPQAFRIETGRSNDRWAHQWIETDAERALQERMNAALEVLKQHRIRIDYGSRLSVGQLEAIAKIVQDGPTE